MNQSLCFKFYHGSIILFILLLSAQHAIAQTDDSTLPPPKFHDTGSHKSLGAGTTVVLVLFISVFLLTGFLSIYLRHCTDSRFSLPHGANGSSNLSRSPSMPHGPGLDPAVVNTFPTFLYSQVKGHRIGERALECAVCLLEFEDDQILRLLPSCNHVFHLVCIDAWLARHVSCPVCRANLIPKPGELVTHVTTILCPPDSDSITTVSKSPPAGYGIDSGSADSIIDIIDTSPTPEHQTLNYQNRPPRSTPRKPKKAGSEFRRSHSAGHTIVQPEDECERFTLRLPEDVRSHLKLMKTSPSSSSTGVFLSVRSPRKGYRSSSLGSSRGKNYERFDSGGRSSGGWNFRMTPPFLTQAGSVRSGGDDSTATPKNLKKSPLMDRMFRGRDKDDDEGRRSTSRLIPDDDA